MEISLREFLIESAHNTDEVEVVVSSRLADHKFTIKPIGSDEHALIVAKCRDSDDAVDLIKVKVALAIEQCIKPNFRDATFLADLKCVTPEQAIKKVLYAGEIIRLADAIGRISGFSEDIKKLDSLVKESKNS